MNSKVICLASAKGGSGKTSICANLASLLNNLGKKCLIIDCDAATHGMTLMYLVEVSNNITSGNKGLFDFQISDLTKENLNKNIISVENGVDFLPATYKFVSGFDPEDNFEESALRNILKLVKDQYDVVFLDAQAGSDKYSCLAMNKEISDEVVIVTEYDPLSSAGVERLKEVIGDDLSYSRTWILLNKMLPEFIENFSEFLSISKYLSPIPWNADVVRAYAKRKLALDTTKGNTYTLSMIKTIEGLFGDSVKDSIQEWLKSKEYALKEPINEQYENAEKELKYLLEAQEKMEVSRKRNLLIKSYMALVPVILLPFITSRFFDLDVFKFFSDYLSTSSSMIVIFGLIIPILYILTNRIISEPKNKAEEYKFKRRISTLEEKINHLESLKSADISKLISKEL